MKKKIKLFSNIKICYSHFKILLAVDINANGCMNFLG